MDQSQSYKNINHEKLECLTKLKEKELEVMLNKSVHIYDWSYSNNNSMLFVDILFEDGQCLHSVIFCDNKNIARYREILEEKKIENLIEVAQYINNLYAIGPYGKSRICGNLSYEQYLHDISNTIISSTSMTPNEELIEYLNAARGDFIIEGNADYEMQIPRTIHRFEGKQIRNVLEELKQYTSNIRIRSDCVVCAQKIMTITL